MVALSNRLIIQQTSPEQSMAAAASGNASAPVALGRRDETTHVESRVATKWKAHAPVLSSLGVHYAQRIAST